jgi:hypothetical protein
MFYPEKAGGLFPPYFATQQLPVTTTIITNLAFCSMMIMP